MENLFDYPSCGRRNSSDGIHFCDECEEKYAEHLNLDLQLVETEEDLRVLSER